MIFKKLLLILMLLFSTIYALETPQLEIISKSRSSLTVSNTQAPQAWIGIYRKDAPLVFENVLTWEWVTSDTTQLSISKIPDGEYEARLFYNNSFQLEKSVTFQHVNGQGPSERYNRIKDESIFKKRSNDFNISYRERGVSNTTDWVGIFKPNTLHIRKNLLAWGYLIIPNDPKEKIGTIQIKTLNNQTLKLGQYDMVCFANNGYEQQLGETKTLTVDFRAKFTQGIEGTSNHILDAYEYIKYLKQENDWIAVFKKDAEPIRENIIAWSYIHDGIPAKGREEIKELLEFPSITHIYPYAESDKYKVIIFEKDTYKIIKTIIHPF